MIPHFFEFYQFAITIFQNFFLEECLIVGAENYARFRLTILRPNINFFTYILTNENISTIIHMNSHSSIHTYKRKGEVMDNKLQPIDRCDCIVIHEEIVNEVKKKMPREEDLYDLAELFKVFGDSTRIKILWALHEAEMCVCDIAVLLNMTQSAISHQLRVLKQAHLVKNRKEGKVVYYSLDDDHVKQIFDQGLDHVNEQ